MNDTSSAPALVQRILTLDSTLRVPSPLVGATHRLSSETGVCVSGCPSTLYLIHHLSASPDLSPSSFLRSCSILPTLLVSPMRKAIFLVSALKK